MTSYTHKLLIGIIRRSREQVKNAIAHGAKIEKRYKISCSNGLIKAYSIAPSIVNKGGEFYDRIVCEKKVHAPSGGFYTPLTYAIAIDDLELVQLLLTKADVNYAFGNYIPDTSENTYRSPLLEALQKTSQLRIKICRLLLNAGVKFQCPGEHNNAIYFLNRILDEGTISSQRFISLCQALITAGFHFELALDRLLFTAIEHSQIKIVDFLLKQKPKDYKWGHDYIKSYGKCTPLLAAIYYQNVNIVEQLLAAGADVDEANITTNKSFDNTKSITPLLLAINKNDITIIKLLLDYGVDVNQQTISKISPLISAISKKQLKTIDMLLSAHADPNQRAGKSNRLPLEVAIRTKNQAICDMLMDNSKNMALNLLGSTHNSLLIEALENNMDEVAAKLIERCINIEAMSAHCETALQVAARHNQVKSVALLLKKLPNRYLNYVNAQGETALFIASQAGYADIVTLLLEAGASDSVTHQNSNVELITNNQEADLPQEKTDTNQQSLQDALREFQLRQEAKLAFCASSVKEAIGLAETTLQALEYNIDILSKLPKAPKELTHLSAKYAQLLDCQKALAAKLIDNHIKDNKVVSTTATDTKQEISDQMQDNSNNSSATPSYSSRLFQIKVVDNQDDVLLKNTQLNVIK